MIPFALKTRVYRLAIAQLRLIGKLRPPRIPVSFAGPGSTRTLATSIAQSGSRRLLIVTDRMLVELGVVDALTGPLEQQGQDYVIYDGVEPDPTVAQVEAGLAMLQETGCDAVLGFGGGSSIDAAKVIAARATNDKPVARMAGLFKVRQPILPLYAVPTTSGTGAEVTIGAVISDPEAERKFTVIDFKLVPLMTALDGELSRNLPAPVTIATGMDALSHAIEAYVSRLAQPDTDLMAMTALRLVLEYLPRAVENGSNDPEARQQMAIAAFCGGCAITKAGAGYVHAISHKVGALYHLPHGIINAVLLPMVLEESRAACADRLAELARGCGLAGEDDTDLAAADALIARIRQLNRQFDIPERLEALRDQDVPAIAAAAHAEARFMYGVPKYIAPARCETLVRSLAA